MHNRKLSRIKFTGVPKKNLVSSSRDNALEFLGDFSIVRLIHRIIKACTV